MELIDLFKLRKTRQNELGRLIEIDDHASVLYDQVGLDLKLESDHPLSVHESKVWSDAIRDGTVRVVVDSADVAVGFIVFSLVDNDPYIEQVSVMPSYMKQGIGRTLIEAAVAWAGERPIWLTTYSHVAWNKPYYEKLGFIEADEANCQAGIRAILERQRQWLPDPDKRIAMVRYQ